MAHLSGYLFNCARVIVFGQQTQIILKGVINIVRKIGTSKHPLAKLYWEKYFCSYHYFSTEKCKYLIDFSSARGNLYSTLILICSQLTEAYLSPSQASMMELFCRVPSLMLDRGLNAPIFNSIKIHRSNTSPSTFLVR